LEIDYEPGKKQSIWRMILPTISDRDALLARLKHLENYREAAYTVDFQLAETQCAPAPTRKINHVRLLLGASTLMHGMVMILFGLALILPIWGRNGLKVQARERTQMEHSIRTSLLVEYVSHFSSAQAFRLFTSFFLLAIGGALVLAGRKILPANIGMDHPGPQSSRPV
jgi:hypothetical protein